MGTMIEISNEWNELILEGYHSPSTRKRLVELLNDSSPQNLEWLLVRWKYYYPDLFDNLENSPLKTAFNQITASLDAQALQNILTIIRTQNDYYEALWLVSYAIFCNPTLTTNAHDDTWHHLIEQIHALTQSNDIKQYFMQEQAPNIENIIENFITLSTKMLAHQKK